MTTAQEGSVIVEFLEKGYNGKLLNVDLTTGTITVERPDEETYRKYLGGYGLGARMMWDRVPAGVDPLGPENMLGMFPGLMTGTPLFGQRWQVVCKSPLTNGWGDSNCGGDFGGILKLAGWDGIMFFGKSPKPVYLFIDDETVELRDATEMWGTLAIANESLFKEMYGKKTSVANIGPSGETLSFISGICNDHGRLAARSGVGAVMGSKMLKAVVVAPPDRKVMSQTPENIKLLRSNLDQMLPPLKDFFHSVGTTGTTAQSAHSGDSPVRNWGGVGVIDFPDAKKIDGATQFNPRMDKSYGCFRCPIACGAESHASENEEYPYPKHTHRPEYEANCAFGTMNLIADPDALIYANHLCNEYGLDVISAGATVSMAFECYEKGIISSEDTGGLELTWGNTKAMIEFLKMMGERRGLGDVFADGVKMAAERLGPEAEPFAIHIGGQEPAMHDPKHNPNYYTVFKIDPTPGRHTQYEPNGRAAFMPQQPQDRKDYTNRGPNTKVSSDYMHVVNSAGMCAFVMMTANADNLPMLFNAVTDWDLTIDEVLQTGERIGALRMAWEVREGNNPRQRVVPPRVTGESTESTTAGPHLGVRLDTERLELDYLKELDFDPDTCKPSRAKLVSLGLEDVAAVLHA